MEGTLGELFSKFAGLTFFWGTVQQLVPKRLRYYLEDLWDKVMFFFFPYIHITFHEYTNGVRNEAYSTIQTYLGSKSNKQAKRLQADKSENSKSLVISLEEGEEIIDEFEGAELHWQAYKERIQDSSSSSSRRRGSFEKNYYVLTFHTSHQDIVTDIYLNHVMEEGKEIEYKNSIRKLYTNNNSENFWYGGMWNYVTFQHPATFDTLAMDPKKKQEIIDDLVNFRNGKDYYAKVGKVWKRGYLLYGPPGTGKSTMIAAIANFLDYDIYDLELTSVKDNSELKQLLIDTTSKSIIVIEDIDCSLDLTGERNRKSSTNPEKKKQEYDQEENKNGKVTLSGLLNFIDGIWSACGQERIIIFTTNHVEKLDPALIRRGRMDMHIEMSYCKFEAFKVLAKNYLGIDSHPLFGEIRDLLKETNTSPCDVAENLMTGSRDAESCLMNLIQILKAAKVKGRSKQEMKANATKSVSKLMKNFRRLLTN